LFSRFTVWKMRSYSVSMRCDGCGHSFNCEHSARRYPQSSSVSRSGCYSIPIAIVSVGRALMKEHMHTLSALKQDLEWKVR